MVPWERTTFVTLTCEFTQCGHWNTNHPGSLTASTVRTSYFMSLYLLHVLWDYSVNNDCYNLFPIILSSCKQLQLLRNSHKSIIRERMRLLSWWVILLCSVSSSEDFLHAYCVPDSGWGLERGVEEDRLKQRDSRLSEGILGVTVLACWTSWDEGFSLWCFISNLVSTVKGLFSRDKHTVQATCNSPCGLNITQNDSCPVPWDKSTDHVLGRHSNVKFL